MQNDQGPMLGREFATRVVDQVNSLAPDLIVITGDFIDGRLSELLPHIDPFREVMFMHCTKCYEKYQVARSDMGTVVRAEAAI